MTSKERIEQILQHTGWDKVAFAQYLGVSQRAVEFWLDGRSVGPDNMARIEYLEDRLTSGDKVEPSASPFHSKVLGTKALAVRRALQLSQNEMGELLKLSGRTYGRFEAEEASPSPEVRKIIVGAYRRLIHQREDPGSVMVWLRGVDVPDDRVRLAQQELFEVVGTNHRPVYLTRQEMEFRKEVASMCRHLREVLQITQKGLATRINANQAQISRYELMRVEPYPEHVEGLRELMQRIEQAGPEDVAVPKGPEVSEQPALTPDRFATLVKLANQMSSLPSETKSLLVGLTELEWEYLLQFLRG